MLGFIELHLNGQFHDGKPKPISIAVNQIAAFFPAENFVERCTIVPNFGGEEIWIVEESYEEVRAAIQTFQQQLAAGSTPRKPFLNVQRGIPR